MGFYTRKIFGVVCNNRLCTPIHRCLKNFVIKTVSKKRSPQKMEFRPMRDMDDIRKDQSDLFFTEVGILDSIFGSQQDLFELQNERNRHHIVFLTLFKRIGKVFYQAIRFAPVGKERREHHIGIYDKSIHVVYYI